MALTYGYFNSIDGDRKYSAEDFGGFFDGLIHDGIYRNVGQCFEVKAFSGMQVSVGTGRAWFDHTWTLNTTKYMLDIPESDKACARIDAVVIEINKKDRKNYIKVLKGTPSLYTQKPKLQKDTFVTQYALAYITVPKNATKITQADIESAIGTSETQYCATFQVDWMPSGGKIGYVLAKASSTTDAMNWYDIHHLPYEDWMYPNGISKEDVIAAFMFKGAASENAALKNCNESDTTYTLSKSSSTNITWSAENGFHIEGTKEANKQGYLLCEALMNTNIKTIVVKYANAAPDPDNVNKSQVHLVTKAFKNNQSEYKVNNRISLYARVGGAYQDLENANKNLFGHPKPGIYWCVNDGNISTTDRGYVYINSDADMSSGVLGCYTVKVKDNENDYKKIYYNGVDCSGIDVTGNTSISKNAILSNAIINETSCVLIGDTPRNASDYFHGSVDIHAIIFFSVKLSRDQMVSVHEAMNALP